MKNSALCVFQILISIFLYSQELRTGVFVHDPMMNLDAERNEVYGKGVDYTGKIAKETGYEFRLAIVPFGRIFTFLKTGDIDITLDVGKFES